MVQADQWRRQEAARLAIITARTTAVLSRAKRIPPLRSLLRDGAERQSYRTPAEQREFLREWALSAQSKKRAVAVGHLATPFDPMRLDPKTSPSMARRLGRG